MAEANYHARLVNRDSYRFSQKVDGVYHTCHYRVLLTRVTDLDWSQTPIANLFDLRLDFRKKDLVATLPLPIHFYMVMPWR